MCACMYACIPDDEMLFLRAVTYVAYAHAKASPNANTTSCNVMQRQLMYNVQL